MAVSLEDMREMLQEWFAQSNSIAEVRDIYTTIKSEIDTQFEFMIEEIVQKKNV